MKHRLVKSALAAAALSLGGAALPAQAGPFDQLEVTETTTTFSQYDRVYIAPVIMDLTFDEQFRQIRRIQRPRRGATRPMTEAEIERKANDLHKDLVQALGKRLTIVDAPGEGVLTVQATVTRIIPSRPTGAELNQRIGLQLGGSISAGGVDINAELSENGVSLAQIGEDYKSNLTDGIPRINIWQDADRGYNRFARKLSRYLARN